MKVIRRKTTVDVFTKKYLHNAVKHAESTLSGNYKSGNNFAKK